MMHRLCPSLPATAATLLLALMCNLAATADVTDVTTISMPDAEFRSYFSSGAIYDDNSGALSALGYQKEQVKTWSTYDDDFNPIVQVPNDALSVIKTMKRSGKTIQVIEGIGYFTALNTVIFKNCNLSDNVDLSNLTRLTKLDLSGNKNITSLTLPTEAPLLKEINICVNNFSRENMIALINSLPDRSHLSVGGKMYCADLDDSDENNVVDEAVMQAMHAARTKGWTFYYHNDKEIGAEDTPIHEDITLSEVIKDDNLRAYLRRYAYQHNRENFNNYNAKHGTNLPVDGSLDKDEWTGVEVELITKIDYYNTDLGEVSTLEGIEEFDNLTYVDFDGCLAEACDTVDLSQLPNLNTIYLSYNSIKHLKLHHHFNGTLSVVDNQLSAKSLIYLAQSLDKAYGRDYYDTYFNLSGNPGYDASQTPNLKPMVEFAFVNRLFLDAEDYEDWSTGLSLSDIIPDANLREYLQTQAAADNNQPASAGPYPSFISQFTTDASSETGKRLLEVKNAVVNSENPYNVDEWDPAMFYLIRNLQIDRWNAANPDKPITDLSGIRYFTMLENLEVNGLNLTSLDVSDMPFLRVLRCPNQQSENGLENGLKTLNVEGCDSLFQIYCDHNLLEQLDVTSLDSLKMLRCNNNPIGSNGLDVTQNSGLVHLDCFNCSLEQLDVTKNPKLKILYCYETRDNEANDPKTAISDGVNSSRETIYGNGTTRRGKIQTLNLSNNPELVELRCSNNPIKGLDLKYNPKLEILYVNSIDMKAENSLQTNLGYTPMLKRLSCYNANLDALDVSKNSHLKELICYKNNIKWLDLNGNTNLKYLSTGEAQAGADARNARLPEGGNPIRRLDVSSLTNLDTLHCCRMELTDLDLTGLTKLKDLDYQIQYRRIRAEAAKLSDTETFFYLRMDKNISDNGFLLTDRIADSDYTAGELGITGYEQASEFDIELVDMSTWTNGKKINSTNKRNAVQIVTDESEINTDKVIGNILMLTDVTHDTENDEYTGETTYSYDVKLPSEATATDHQTPFTLGWYAPAEEDKIITGVTDLTAAGEVESVTYVNVAGQTSTTPWSGINLVITRYTNGTSTTEKRLF